ncbi:MAG TPA: hypothetical protein VGJ51_11900 [Candidatus Angelobacter sp.]
MNRIAILLLSACLITASAAAQESAPKEKMRTFTFTQDEPVTMVAPLTMMLQRERLPEGEISFFSAEMAGAGEVVTAAPYTATATTESTQVLADGNKIVNKTSSFVARDSQGRTRRETDLHRIGTMQVDSPKTVFINDPTAHTQYIFTPGGEATKVIRSEGNWKEGPQIIELGSQRERSMKEKVFFNVQGTRERQQSKESSEQVKHEDLGTQTIEGVSAQGKRETVTIPAGQIGNDRPIEIVSETWYSPDLHTMVLRKHSDPRLGETVFRLTDIKRNEPDASLFQPPAGTKLRSEPLIELHKEIAPSKE